MHIAHYRTIITHAFSGPPLFPERHCCHRHNVFNLILIINGVGIPGRLVPALIADKYLGPVNVFIPVMFIAGTVLFCWAAPYRV
jgi:hypothetical protein